MRQRKATTEDIAIGQRIRAQRIMCGISQGTLADALGVSFQQIQKYEKGVNRVGSGRIVEIAKVLNTTVSALLDVTEAGANKETAAIMELLTTREGVAMAKSFMKLPPDLRRQIAALVDRVAA
jgi:transcriptional regulator with XRE-family HTH domain